MSDLSTLLAHLGAGDALSAAQAESFFTRLLEGELDHSQAAFALGAFSARGETATELLAAIQILRQKAAPFPHHANRLLVDTCGTGGDKKGSYNISTAVAFVAAGAGVAVAKHGNKAVSSASGSSDVLLQLGVKIDAAPDSMARALDQASVCFLLAPLYHPAMRHVAPLRAALKTRTLFNLLGPLLNPAQVTRQVIGVYDPAIMDLYAQLLPQLGAEKTLLVHGLDGMDEITLCAPTKAMWLENGIWRKEDITPEAYGLTRCVEDALAGGDAAYNAAALTRLLAGETGPYRDVVLLNAAAALCVADAAQGLEDGIQKAAASINSGAAHAALAQLVEISQS